MNTHPTSPLTFDKRTCPMQGYECMISDRREFRAVLQYFKSYEQQLRDNKLLYRLAGSNCRIFQKEADYQRDEGHSNNDEIQGFVNEEAMASLFMHKFSSLTGKVSDNIQFEPLYNQNVVSWGTLTLTDFRNSVHSLKTCIDFDGTHCNHVKILKTNNPRFGIILKKILSERSNYGLKTNIFTTQ